MKKQILLKSIIAVILTGVAITTTSCKKKGNNGQNTNNVQGSISLTYAGNTIVFDSSYSTLPARGSELKRILGKNKNAVVNSFHGAGTFCYFDIDNMAVGKHTHGAYQQFDLGVTFVDNSVYKSDGISEYIYTIISNNNSKISGTFAFRLNTGNASDSVRGSFKDISIQ